MSRVGKQQLAIPEKTEVTLVEGVLTAKGPKGTLSRAFKDTIVITITDKVITLAPKKVTVDSNALWGTYASHIKNMIAGVNTPYQKKLILEGVGFKSEIKPARPDDSGRSGGGKNLDLALGFSHPVTVPIPDGLTVTAEKNVITVTGIDKELVGSFTAMVRGMKKPEPYKGKGFRYDDEVIRRKQGKKSA